MAWNIDIVTGQLQTTSDQIRQTLVTQHDPIKRTWDIQERNGRTMVLRLIHMVHAVGQL